MKRGSLTIGCATLLALLVFSLCAQQAGAPGAAQAGRGGGRGSCERLPMECAGVSVSLRLLNREHSRQCTRKAANPAPARPATPSTS